MIKQVRAHLKLGFPAQLHLLWNHLQFPFPVKKTEQWNACRWSFFQLLVTTNYLPSFISILLYSLLRKSHYFVSVENASSNWFILKTTVVKIHLEYNIGVCAIWETFAITCGSWSQRLKEGIDCIVTSKKKWVS